jgi:hypothetical protein
MVAEVRRGRPLRFVARMVGVALSVVQYWVHRAMGERLDRVDWSNRMPGSRSPGNRTSSQVEDRVLSIRKFLREESALGEHGPQAIHREMLRRRFRNVPAVRTIARVLERRGALDGQRRVRRTPPPRGWFLLDVAAEQVELDSFDIVEDLVIAGGHDVNVLTAMSLHGGCCNAWPRRRITAKIAVDSLVEHWREHGLPGYAKFDNDTVFQGAHIHPDTFGRVIRLCLSLGVTPVFAPPRETGFQADIENFNGRWQRAVWERFTFRNLLGVQRQSRKFVIAQREKSAARIQAAPRRRRFPRNWRLNLQAPLTGTVIFLRRTDAKGRVTFLGHTFHVSSDWCSRLIRAEVDLTRDQIRFYALRRREPQKHRYLGQTSYKPKRKYFHE